MTLDAAVAMVVEMGAGFEGMDGAGGSADVAPA